MSRFSMSRTYVLTALLVTLALAAVFMAGCEGSEQQQAEAYKKQYEEIIGALQKQVEQDDKKGTELLQNDDVAGLISLDAERKKSVEKVFGEVIELDPPPSLWRVQAITLYYLVSIEDQLDRQDDYYEALISGKPTGDLQTIAENSAAKAKVVGRDLAVELQKAGITIMKPGGPQSSTPAQSVPEGSQ